VGRWWVNVRVCARMCTYTACMVMSTNNNLCRQAGNRSAFADSVFGSGCAEKFCI